MKDAYWFPHDSNANQDPKMAVLINETGLSGYGMYWILIEIMHQQEDGKISKSAYQSYIKMFYGLSDSTRGQHMLDKIQQVLISSGLMIEEDGYVYSPRVIRNKQVRKEIAAKRSFAGIKSAESRANLNINKRSTSVELIKESKVKERKEQEEEKIKNSAEPSTPKIKHLDFVYLTEKEFQTWTNKTSPEILAAMIEKLDGWIGALKPEEGKKPTKEFLQRCTNGMNATNTFTSWVFNSVMEQKLKAGKLQATNGHNGAWKPVNERVRDRNKEIYEQIKAKEAADEAKRNA